MNRQPREAAAYFRLASTTPVLDRKTEHDLAVRYQQLGCRRSADRLACSMLRFVITVAVKYSRADIPLSDLISEGMVGVMKAMEKFEPERRLRFVTFASYWVRAEIGTAVLKNQSMVRTLSLRPKVLHRLRRERRRALSQFGECEEAFDHLAAVMEVDRSQLDIMLTRLDARDVSLDLSDTEGGTALYDRLAQPGPSPEEQVARTKFESGISAEVRGALDALDPRERFIAESRLLACPDDELSLADIGRKLHVTRERARQLEVRTKAKLRAQLTPHRPSESVAAA